MRRIRQAVGILLLAIALVYAGDYISVRYRISGGREPFGTVQVTNEYAVTLKNKKVEFYFDPPQDQPCVNSLFPHFGDPPCWWLRRKPVRLIRM